STTGVGIGLLFSELYQVRKSRLRIIIRMTEQYLESINSHMEVRDYLASIWALTHGAAAILNSSFYQRYLGSRDTLRVAYIDQALAMPKQAQSFEQLN
ncbi:MAG: TetR/AcrR family transcriptional regulator, partial [Acinetobacter towneri]